MPLEPSRRREAAEWAARTGALVIDDDYDGELRHDRPAVGAMQAGLHVLVELPGEPGSRRGD